MNKQERLNQIAGPLLKWYDGHRRVLPWRENRDPSRIWVSEIMLQQTRVAAVLPYYARWMEELPNVAALAAVEEDRLMKLWEGLGYYSRARNLQKAARMIMEECGGAFPCKRDDLLKLPGVGEYTAGAIASIAFDERVSAVDGNVLRIAARVAEIHEDILDAKVKKGITAMMEEAMPEQRCGDYNQALMDLGATVCLPNGKPLCESCPLASFCAVHAAGTEEALPVRKKKAKRRKEEMTVYLLLREGKVALRRRSDEGLLAGLWEFPHVSGTLSEKEAADPVEHWGLRIIDWREQLHAKHIFTHVEWHMTGYVLSVRGEQPEFTWVDEEQLEDLAVPSAFAKFLEAAKKAMKRETN